MKWQLKLVNIFFNGYGVDRDLHNAMKYMELSAKQNNEDALFFIGNFYSSNEICDRSILNFDLITIMFKNHFHISKHSFSISHHLFIV